MNDITAIKAGDSAAISIAMFFTLICRQNVNPKKKASETNETSQMFSDLIV